MFMPDERAVMTYLSCFYHAFQGLHKVKCLFDYCMRLVIKMYSDDAGHMLAHVY